MKDFFIKAVTFDKQKIISLVLSLAIGAVFIYLYTYTSLLAGLESGSIDFRFYLRAPEQRFGQIKKQKVEMTSINERVNPNIVIMGVDEASLSKIGPWPWPWSVHADLIRSLSQSKKGPAGILFDIFFIDHKQLFSAGAKGVLQEHLSPEEYKKVMQSNQLDEERLARAVEQADNVYLDYPFYAQKTKASITQKEKRMQLLRELSWEVPPKDINLLSWVKDVIPPLYEIGKGAAGLGYANIRYEEQQTVNRRMPLVVKYQGRFYPNIDLTLAMDYLGVKKSDVDIKLGEAIYLRNVTKKLVNVVNVGQYDDVIVDDKESMSTDKLFAYRFEGKGSDDHWGKEVNNPGFTARVRFDLAHEDQLKVKNLEVVMVSTKNPDEAKEHKLIQVDEFVVDKRKEVTLGQKVLLAFQPRGDEVQIINNLGAKLTGKLTHRDIMYHPNPERTLRIPVDEEGFMMINFVGGQQSFPNRSYHIFVPSQEASSKEVQEHLSMFQNFDGFDDKILLVAIYRALGLVDVHKSPYGPMFGIEHHANALNTILNQDFLYKLGKAENILIMVILALFLGYLLPRVSIIINAAISLTGLILIFVVAQLLFNNESIVFAVATPAMQLVFTFTGVTVFRVLTEERKSKYIRNTFSKFVSKQVVNELLSDPENVQLGGEDREITIYFNDIRGFTSISEAMTPQELVSLLNEYLTEMTDMIIAENGTLDKYMGDAIMAFWGAPLPMEDHALRACRASVKMIKELHKMQERWIAEGRPPIEIGIGLNTGKATVGNIGSSSRMEYTCMGDTINLGSRLEAINKVYKTNTIMSEFTYRQVKDHVIARELDLIRVKGKTEPVTIYELVDMKE